MPKLSHALPPRTPVQEQAEMAAADFQAMMKQANEMIENGEYVVEGKFSEECVELKVRSREEEILRELGIRHLEDKISRPRYTADETEAEILTQAGVRFLSTNTEREAALNERIMRPLGRKEAEVLRAAGVSWLENAVVDDDASQKLDSGTATTVGESSSTVNSTYAERELLRRLKHGWASTGEECECGMPIICKAKSDLLECVICGVMGGDDENYDPNTDNYNGAFPEDVEGPADGERESPGVIDVNSNWSTITPSLAPHERLDHEYPLDGPIYETTHCHECEAPLKATAEDSVGDYEAVDGVYCSSCATKKKETQNENDEAYKEELGQRLFEGWELTTLNCPGCNLPLISEGEGSPSICLRCG